MARRSKQQMESLRGVVKQFLQDAPNSSYDAVRSHLILSEDVEPNEAKGLASQILYSLRLAGDVYYNVDNRLYSVAQHGEPQLGPDDVCSCADGADQYHTDDNAASAIVPYNFHGHDIRLVERSGDYWWVAKDVCEVLGFANSRDAIARLEADEKGVASIDTLGGQQQLAVINEPGLYNLILTSRKQEAVEFKRWVTHDVLPTLRKQGSYSVGDEYRERPDSHAELILAISQQMVAPMLKSMQEEREQIKAKDQQIAELIKANEAKDRHWQNVFLVMHRDDGLQKQRQAPKPTYFNEVSNAQKQVSSSGYTVDRSKRGAAICTKDENNQVRYSYAKFGSTCKYCGKPIEYSNPIATRRHNATWFDAVHRQCDEKKYGNSET